MQGDRTFGAMVCLSHLAGGANKQLSLEMKRIRDPPILIKDPPRYKR